MNHRLDDGKWRRTIGTITKSNATSPNGTVAMESPHGVITPRKQRVMTIVFGTRNHKRRPRRNKIAMPTGTDIRQRPYRNTKRMPDNDSPPSRHAFTIAHTNNRADSMTYIQAIASTITTGNGFSKSSIAPDLMARAPFHLAPYYITNPPKTARGKSKAKRVDGTSASADATKKNAP